MILKIKTNKWILVNLNNIFSKNPIKVFEKEQ